GLFINTYLQSLSAIVSASFLSDAIPIYSMLYILQTGSSYIRLFPSSMRPALRTEKQTPSDKYSIVQNFCPGKPCIGCEIYTLRFSLVFSGRKRDAPFAVHPQITDIANFIKYL